MKNIYLYKVVYVFILSLFLISCSSNPSSPNIQYDKSSDFSKLHTYSLKADTSDSPDLTINQKVFSAISSALTAKGFQLATDNNKADMSIIFIVGVNSQLYVDSKFYSTAQGTYSTNIPQTKRQATVAIDIIDNSTKKSIWLVSQSREIDFKQYSQQEFNEAISKLLNGFPPK